MKRALSLESRLRLLTLKLPGGCHQWLGLKSGKIRVNGKLQDAKEVALELLPNGIHRFSACTNSKCINPLHELVGR